MRAMVQLFQFQTASVNPPAELLGGVVVVVVAMI
jgi:hypothetical protein